MKLFRKGQRNRQKRGFTLLECVVSIAIFAIMGTMFASFLMSSVRVVNLTLANDRDREALLEAIATARTADCPTANGTVTISPENSKGEVLQLNLSSLELESCVLQDKYVKYTAPNGTVYHIYLGANAMAVQYLALLDKKSNRDLIKAMNSGTDLKDLKVVYKGEKDPFTMDILASDSAAKLQMFQDKEGKNEYVKYTNPIGRQYLIYLYRPEAKPNKKP